MIGLEKMAEPAATELTSNPKHVIASYLVLTFGLSSIFRYIIAVKPSACRSPPALLFYNR